MPFYRAGPRHISRRGHEDAEPQRRIKKLDGYTYGMPRYSLPTPYNCAALLPTKAGDTPSTHSFSTLALLWRIAPASCMRP